MYSQNDEDISVEKVKPGRWDDEAMLKPLEIQRNRKLVFSVIDVSCIHFHISTILHERKKLEKKPILSYNMFAIHLFWRLL